MKDSISVAANSPAANSPATDSSEYHAPHLVYHGEARDEVATNFGNGADGGILGYTLS